LLTSTTAIKSSPIFDMKIEETIAGLQRSFSKKLQSIGEANAAVSYHVIHVKENRLHLMYMWIVASLMFFF
jgi:hypothetical protein